MADEKKLEVIVFNSGHPLKMDIGGRKLQIQDGKSTQPESLVKDMLRFYPHKVKLASDMPKVEPKAEVKPPEVKKEEVKEEVKTVPEKEVPKKRGRPTKI